MSRRAARTPRLCPPAAAYPSPSAAATSRARSVPRARPGEDLPRRRRLHDGLDSVRGRLGAAQSEARGGWRWSRSRASPFDERKASSSRGKSCDFRSRARTSRSATRSHVRRGEAGQARQDPGRPDAGGARARGREEPVDRGQPRGRGDHLDEGPDAPRARDRARHARLDRPARRQARAPGQALPREAARARRAARERREPAISSRSIRRRRSP